MRLKKIFAMCCNAKAEDDNRNVMDIDAFLKACKILLDLPNNKKEIKIVFSGTAFINGSLE